MVLRYVLGSMDSPAVQADSPCEGVHLVTAVGTVIIKLS